jgi:uncharacterized protein (DUF2141 family)
MTTRQNAGSGLRSGVAVAAGLALALSSLASLAEEGAAAPGPFTVEVLGVRGRAGTVRCLLFSEAAGFPQDPARARLRAVAPAAGERVSCTFPSAPQGPFAISVVHDANDNGKLDSNFLGIPTEGYGFSRDAKAGAFGPPAFADAVLPAADAARPLQVHLVYP